MIDINSTLLVQLVNFIVLLVALNYILFKPLRNVMQEREQGISNAFGEAKAAQDRVQELTERYNGLLAESKQKATATYNTIYQQGLDTQRESVSAERAKASEMLDKARADVAAASSAARADLKREAERLAQDIAAKLLGRSA